MNKAKGTVTGAATGAAAGTAVMPGIGTAIGAIGGGLLGYFASGDDEKAPTYTPDSRNFRFGLGPSDTFASLEAERLARERQALMGMGIDAQNREGPTQALPDRIDHVASDGQSFLTGADADARRRQLEALGGIQGQTAALNKFANAPMGPSAAQAQLRAGQDAAARQQYGFARSQPGGGGAALRNAAFNAAGISGNAANSAAMLRAQETQAHRQQQLAALGAAQQGAGMSAGYTGQLRGMDQGMAQMQAGQANYDASSINQFNKGQQDLQFNVGQNNLNAGLQTNRGNDAFTLGMLGIGLTQDQQRLELAKQQTASGIALEQAKAQGAGIGSANFNAGVAQSNNETAMMLGALSGASGAIAKMNQPEAQINAGAPQPTSDIRAKKDIKPVSMLDALGGYQRDRDAADYQNVREQVQSAQASRMGPDTNMREFNPAQPAGFGVNADRQTRLQALLGPRPDMRQAQGYEYAYRDPERHGEGRYVGPMAQDLEHLPGVVEQSQDGTKSINAPRLTLANTAALSETQRELDALKRRQELMALGADPAAFSPTFLRPQLKHPDYAALDAASR